eukprot:13234567-Alexandrium_andersonii.AAC.1
MHTFSPTATRQGHRMVALWCILMGWHLWSLDISTAFLQGWTFEEMREAGFDRQPCAFVVPDGMFDLLKELDPDDWAEAAKNPE